MSRRGWPRSWGGRAPTRRRGSVSDGQFLGGGRRGRARRGGPSTDGSRAAARAGARAQQRAFARRAGGGRLVMRDMAEARRGAKGRRRRGRRRRGATATRATRAKRPTRPTRPRQEDETTDGQRADGASERGRDGRAGGGKEAGWGGRPRPFEMGPGLSVMHWVGLHAAGRGDAPGEVPGSAWRVAGRAWAARGWYGGHGICVQCITAGTGQPLTGTAQCLAGTGRRVAGTCPGVAGTCARVARRCPGVARRLSGSRTKRAEQGRARAARRCSTAPRARRAGRRWAGPVFTARGGWALSARRRAWPGLFLRHGVAGRCALGGAWAGRRTGRALQRQAAIFSGCTRRLEK